MLHPRNTKWRNTRNLCNLTNLVTYISFFPKREKIYIPVEFGSVSVVQYKSGVQLGQTGWVDPSHLPETFNSDENAPPPEIQNEEIPETCVT